MAKNEAERAAVGADDGRRIVVVDKDTEHDGTAYKAGNHDVTKSVASALVKAEKAHYAPGVGEEGELLGRGKGR